MTFQLIPPCVHMSPSQRVSLPQARSKKHNSKGNEAKIIRIHHVAPANPSSFTRGYKRVQYTRKGVGVDPDTRCIRRIQPIELSWASKKKKTFHVQLGGEGNVGQRL